MSNLIQWKGPTNALVMTPKSGKLVASDRIRLTDVYMGLSSLCKAGMLARGTFGSGTRAGWVVNQSTFENDRGNIGTLTIEWEAGGAAAINPLPVGDFSCRPQELYPRIERNKFFINLQPQEIKIAVNAAYFTTQAGVAGDQFTGDLNTLSNFTSSANQTLAQKLYQKLLRGEETFYLAGWRYTFELFSYVAPALDNGGYTGTPGGPLANSLPSNVVWLRLADDLQPAGVNGSMFKNTITWLGGPVYAGVGFWDPDLYPS